MSATRSSQPKAVAILLAAGRGRRMRGAVADKVLATLAGQPVFSWSLASFVESGIVGRFVIVFRDPRQRTRLAALYHRSPARLLPVRWVHGGAERQDSVLHALRAVEEEVMHVFIHDCARPLVHPVTLRALARAVALHGAACLAHRVTDTIKQTPTAAADRAGRLRTIDRSRLWAMETPQAFSRDLITKAYEAVHARGLTITDDTSALEATTRHGVNLVENARPNPKLTTPADLAWAEYLVRGHRAEVGRRKPEVRGRRSEAEENRARKPQLHRPSTTRRKHRSP